MTDRECWQLSHVVHNAGIVVINGIKANRGDRERLLYDAATGTLTAYGFAVGGIAEIKTV